MSPVRLYIEAIDAVIDSDYRKATKRLNELRLAAMAASGNKPYQCKIAALIQRVENRMKGMK